jgi:hypothetical protein
MIGVFFFSSQVFAWECAQPKAPLHYKFMPPSQTSHRTIAVMAALKPWGGVVVSWLAGKVIVDQQQGVGSVWRAQPV